MGESHTRDCRYHSALSGCYILLLFPFFKINHLFPFIHVEGGTPDSVNPSTVEEDEEEEGLPSPPLDEGAFFATQNMELSKVYSGCFPVIIVLIGDCFISKCLI